MFTWSRRSNQKFRGRSRNAVAKPDSTKRLCAPDLPNLILGSASEGRGNTGAHELNPIAPKFWRAPDYKPSSPRCRRSAGAGLDASMP